MRPLSQLKFFALICLLSSGWVSAQIQPIRVACVGNSITYGGLGEQSYPQQLGKLLGSHYSVRNFGVGGTTLLKKGDLPYWNESAFLQAQNFNPQILIISLGTNDSKPQNWTFRENFYPDYLDLINVFRQNNRRPHILVCLPPPVFKDGYGITNSIIRDEIIPLLRMIRKTAKTDSINFYDTMLDKGNLFPDGIHPNAAGYLIMAQIANDEIVNSPSGIIRFFSAKAAAFEKDEAIMLYWETTKNSQVKINGAAVAEFDSMIVYPQQTTVYTLLTVGDVSDTASVTLQYLPPGMIKSFTANPVYIDQGSDDSTTLSWSTTRGSLVRLDGIAVQESGSQQFFPKETTGYTLNARGDMVDSTSLVTVFVLPSDQINRALNHPVVASTTTRGFVPQAAVDGDSTTYWLSGAAATQWIYVDLGSPFEIIRIVLHWGKTYSTMYHLQALNEAGVSSSIFSNYSGDGGVDDIVGLPAKGRYVRLLCIAKSMSDSGYVLKEMQIYGKKVIPSVVSGSADQIPSQFELAQNHPNPFNPRTTISYSLPRASIVSLKVYDLIGRKITTLVHNEEKAAGNHKVLFDAASLPSGVYLCRLYAGGFAEIKTMKMLLIK